MYKDKSYCKKKMMNQMHGELLEMMHKQMHQLSDYEHYEDSYPEKKSLLAVVKMPEYNGEVKKKKYKAKKRK